MKFNISYILIFLSLALLGCAVFEEKPVTQEIINIISPSDSAIITNKNVAFKWSEVQNSNPVKYNIQIVSPSFQNATSYWVDTSVSKTSFSKILDPGNYQCRINVYNGSSKSQYSTVSFSIDTNTYIKDVLTIVSPSDGYVSSVLNISLAWNAVKYANAYQLQIYSIDTDGLLVNRLFDTTVSSTKLTYRLPPGSYKWQVRATNIASSSNYSSRSFKIDTVHSLLNQPVTLLLPENNTYINSLTQKFKWQKVNYATNYKIEFAQNGFSSQSARFAQYTSNDTITCTLPVEGTYQWRITAYNTGTGYTTSDNRNFTSIVTKPDKPILQSPQNNNTLTSAINFNWSKKIQTIDKIYLYSQDSNQIFNGYPIQLPYEATSASGSYTVNLPSGLYYWGIQSTDLAGNKSDFSVKWKFIVTP